MDEDILSLQNFIQVMNQIRIESNLTCIREEFRYRNYMSVFISLEENKENFSYNKLCLYQKLEETDVPEMEGFMVNMKILRFYNSLRIEWDRDIALRQIGSENESELWDGLLEGYKMLKQYLEQLEKMVNKMRAFRNHLQFLISQ